MESSHIFNMALVLLIPSIGLLCGAILPPLYYTRQFGLSLIANLVGFLIYIIPPFWLALHFSTLGQAYGVSEVWNPLLTGFLLAALAFFIAVEGLVFFLRWLKRYLRLRCEQR